MNLLSKDGKMPLFVNTSQLQKYNGSDTVSVSDRSAGRNIFSNFSTKQNAYTSQSTRMNNIETSYKGDSTASVSYSSSPVFGRQKPMVSLSNDQNSMTIGCDSTRTPSSTDAEDSDSDSSVIIVPSSKRRRLLTDTDSSDDLSGECGGKVCKSSSSSESNEPPKNIAAAMSRVQRLSHLEDRHCFDPLLNCDNSSTYKSLQKSFDKPLRGKNTLRDSVKCISQSPCESLRGTVAGESDRAEGNAIHSASNQCSIRLNKLQLCDVSPRIILSQQDKLSLCRSSTVDSEAPTVDNDSTLTASADLVHLGEMSMNIGSVLQSSNVCHFSSDDLFSDNEAVESVCLSPSHYRSPDEQRIDIVQKTPEYAEVPSVSYSQADDDDCILIDDSDDELFANLTQNDITIKVEDDDERHHSDECEEFVGADDAGWMEDDIDGVTAAALRNSVVETQVASDPWICDVADISSDELEEAYDAAMSYARRDEAQHTVSTDSVAVSQKIHGNDYDALTVANMRQQCTTSPCKVSLKRLRMIDIPAQIRLSQEDKRLCEPDVDCESDDSRSVVLPASVSSMSILCEVSADTTHGDLQHEDNNISAVSCEKPEAAQVSCNLTDTEKLISGDIFAASGRKSGSSVSENVKNDVFNECWRVSSRQRDTETFYKGTSVHDPCNVTKNVEVKSSYEKKSTVPRIALEHCVEVAEFYGTKVPHESKWYQCESTVIKGTTNVDKCAAMNNENSSVSALPHVKKDKSRLIMTEPHHLKPHKHDTVKLGDSSACKQEEWKNKSAMRSSSTASSSQYQKISQMRDYGRKKLRRDKTSSADGRQNCDSYDRFQGLSQFSVAKQQLVERTRQLKASGLYCFCLSVNLRKSAVQIWILKVCSLKVSCAAITFHIFQLDLQWAANI